MIINSKLLSVKMSLFHPNFFFQHFPIEIFKYKKKLRIFNEYLYAYQLHYRVNIIILIIVYPSIYNSVHSSIHLIFYAYKSWLQVSVSVFQDNFTVCRLLSYNFSPFSTVKIPFYYLLASDEK